MLVLVGTSGWQYRHWRDVFYPADVPQRRWLEHYAGRLATVENNDQGGAAVLDAAAFARLTAGGGEGQACERQPTW